jgi:hypothetical protein
MKQFIFVFLMCWNDVVSYDLSSNFVMIRNWDYRGNNSRSITNQVSYAECHTQCLKNDKCNAFTWDMTTQMCYLKSSTDNDGQSALFAHSGRRQGKRDRYEKLKCFRILFFLFPFLKERVIGAINILKVY